MSIAYSALVDQVLALAHPERIASRLLPKKQRHVQSGLIHLQRKLKHLRENNTNTHLGDDSYDCGLTVVDAPSGHVKRVWATETVLEEGVEQNSRVVEYFPCGFPEIEARREEWLANGGTMLDDDGNYIHALPITRGVFAIHEGSVWAYPAALPPWDLRIAWLGIKQQYEPSDQVELTNAEVDLLVKYVLWAGCGDGGCGQQEKPALYRDFAEALMEEMRQRHEEELAQQRYARSVRSPMCGMALHSYKTATTAPP
jgi:hypothetical protein